MEMLKNKLDVRAFAVEQSMKCFGSTANTAKMVETAKAIESYMLEGLDLPDAPVPSSEVLSSLTTLAGAILESVSTDQQPAEVKPAEN